MLLPLFLLSFNLVCLYGQRTQTPVITNIVPATGGLQGGTRVTIVGRNFLQNGLQSQHAVYFGDSPCPVIDYYSTNNALVCVVPACSSTSCVTQTNFRGSSTVDVNVFVLTVETELGAVPSSFTYTYSQTPLITRMDHTTYATATSSITGRTISNVPDNFEIKIDGQYADLGDFNEFNLPSNLNNPTWSTNNQVRYRPPFDITAGFRNLTFKVQDLTDINNGPGFADTLPDYYPLDLQSDPTYMFNYASTLLGTTYSVLVLPTISSVSTKQGSVAGGTTVVIRGHGFTQNSIVFAGGELCKIQSVAIDSLTCITSPHRATLVTNHFAEAITANTPIVLNSTRKYGSPGAWLKMWKLNDPSYGKDAKAAISVPWRDGTIVSMSKIYGTYWYRDLGSSFNKTKLSYSGSVGFLTPTFDFEMRTILVAPVSGNYSFFIDCDDNLNLYDTNNKLMAKCTYQYSNIPYEFWRYAGRISKPVHLKKGDHYPLRLKSTNFNGPDFTLLAMKILPDYLPDGSTLKDSLTNHLLIDSSTEPPVPSTFSDKMLRLQALRDIQTIELSMFHQLETQVLTLSGYTSGLYIIMIEQLIFTTYIGVNDPYYMIESALRAAALQLPSPKCTSFSVTTRYPAPKTLEITVRFNVENAVDLPLLVLFNDDLLLPTEVDCPGCIKITPTTRTTQHSVIPSGTLDISLSSPFNGNKTTVNYDVSATDMKTAIESLRSDLVVNVIKDNSRTYNITFLEPRGLIPKLRVDITNLIASQKAVNVTRIQKADGLSLFYNPIPVWMTEIPIDWATNGKTVSNIEVYSKTDSGEVIKAVCDATGFVNGSFFGNHKGSENDCSFVYSTNVTALVTSSTISQFELNHTERIVILGKGFSRSNNNNTNAVVTIGGSICKIVSLLDTEIVCLVNGVIGGSYRPVVNIPGLGDALHASTSQLIDFHQFVYTITQHGDSVSGGGILEVIGRSFVVPGNITIGGGLGKQCVNIASNDWRIRCRMPAVTGRPLGPTDTFSFPIIINGVVNSTKVSYSVADTPTVTSITPNRLSFAQTATLTITGTQFTNLVSVTVGTQVCTVITSDDTTISCLLSRSADITTGDVQTVYVEVLNQGYAALATSLSHLPTVRRSFEITKLSTNTGSYYGGNVLNISGVGFTDVNKANYSVTLVNKNTIGDFSSYNDVLKKLGLPTIASQYVPCAISVVHYEYITCQIVHATPDPTGATADFILLQAIETQILDFNVVVSLNNLNTICVDSAANSTKCSYTQSMLVTPIISFATITSFDTNSKATVAISGRFLSTTAAMAVTIAGRSCTVLSRSLTAVTVQSSSVISGLSNISIYIDGIGYSNPDIQVSVPLDVSNAQTAITVTDSTMSVAGGAEFIITGVGFNDTNCNSNNILLNVNFINTPIDASSFIHSCSNTFIALKLPPIVTYIKTSANTNFVINSIAVTVGDLEVDFLLDTAVTYAKTHTPTVALSALAGIAGDVVVMNVTSYGTLTASTLSVGNTQCSSLHIRKLLKNSLDLTSFVCTIPQLKAGSQPVLISTTSGGYAAVLTGSVYSLPVFTSTLTVTPATAASHTTGANSRGGQILTINGTGFYNETSVTLCDATCAIVSASYSQLHCRIPMHQSQADVAVLQTKGFDLLQLVAPIKVGTWTTSNSNIPISLALDGLYSTVYEDTSSAFCSITLSIPAGYAVKPDRMRFYPKYQHASKIIQVVFQGSADNGVNYFDLGTLATTHEGWNFITAHDIGGASILGSTWYTNFRYKSTAANSASTSRCALAEIEFSGIIASPAIDCTVHISALTAGVVSFQSLDLSPVIESISPTQGTALGGTAVTLTGKNLILNTDSITAVSVKFSGIDCVITARTATTIDCITGPRPPEAVETASTSVLFDDAGYALIASNIEYLYIDKWSEQSSWLNGELPVDGDFVYITEGQVLMLDVNSPVLSVLLIAGSLYFDTTKDVSLDASYIFVLGGLMQVGTEAEPYQPRAVITLHGDRYTTIELPYIGAKVLAVASKGAPMAGDDEGIRVPSRNVGRLEVHGQKRLRTWTYLAETALQGTNKIVTSEPVDFMPGDVLILPGTEIPGGSGDPSEDFGYELVTVVENDDEFNIILSAPLNYTHRSEILLRNDRWVDLRCPVGLLNRNVIIQGDDNSFGQLFGVHTVAMMSGIYRMENAEIRNCGQAFNFGRYCTHSHRAGNMEGSYVKANSIHQSFQRAVTTHDTRSWEVRDNVAFDIQGHAYFVEDGTEQFNSFSGNLGILVRRSTALLGSDMKPAVFWTATPSNYWYDNVGMHSASFGMWFELGFSRPSGDTDADPCPAHQSLGQFRNNTFASNGVMGLRIYPEYTPYVDPCDSSSGPAPQYFYNLLSYRNGGNGLFSKRHGDLHHIGHILVENGGDEISIVKYVGVDYTTNPTFLNILVIAQLNAPAPGQGVGKFALNAPQNEFFYVKDMTVVNYGTSGAITTCNECLSGENMNQGGNTYRFEGMVWDGTTKRILWTETKKDIIWDLDGTMGGIPGYMLTYYRAYNHWPECNVLNPAIYDTTTQCAIIRRVQIDQFSPTYNTQFTDIVIESAVGKSSLYYLPLDTSGWVATVVNNHTYTLDWKATTNSMTQYRLTYGRDEYLLESIANNWKEGVEIDYSHNVVSSAYSYNIRYNGKTKLCSTNHTVLSDMGQSYYSNNTLATLLTTNNAVTTSDTPFAVSVAAQKCPPSGCYVPPAPQVGAPMLWSNASTWLSNELTVPAVGKLVIVSNTMWVVLDVTTPFLGCLRVEGKLTFISKPGVDIRLNVKCLVVYGDLQIVGDNNTDFLGTATINVYGAVGASLPVLVSNKVFVGSKVISIMGSFIVKGKPVLNTWLPITESLPMGGKIIKLSQLVDWKAGNDIVLSQTAYYDNTGAALLETTNAIDIQKIKSIDNTLGYSVITIQGTFNQSHLCHQEQSESFCGYIGLLTRSIVIKSSDSENPASTSYGYGAHIQVFDVNRPVQAIFQYVQFENLGKIRTDKYALSFQTLNSNYARPKLPNIVKGCSFNNMYNFVVAAVSGVTNLTISNIVSTRSVAGGIFVDKVNSGVVIHDNLLMGIYNNPAVIESSYQWNRPIAAFFNIAPTTIIYNNVAAGSVDSGFYLGQSSFTGRASSTLCATTHGGKYTLPLQSVLSQGMSVYNNEAVGCQVGLTLVTVSGSEVAESSCAVIIYFKAWRNAHAGIMSADTKANVLVASNVLAENHIGLTLGFYKTAESAFSGLVSSKVIGLFSDVNTPCGYADSNWVNTCRVFWQGDPLAVNSNTCHSTLKTSGVAYSKRVGLLLPQWLNAPRTCAVAGRFGVCFPPTTIDRLCALPFETRYGVTVGIQYPEQHIVGTIFAGFSMNSACSPTQNSVAIAMNPAQIDQQPTILMNTIVWQNVPTLSRFGFQMDFNHPVIIHDFDGSVRSQPVAGQILFNSPTLAAPTPRCSADSDVLGSGFYFCSATVASPFKQYMATWHDVGPQVIQPLIIQRNFSTPKIADFRNYPAFGPVEEMCAIRMFFSRFNFLLASGMKNRIQSTGTTPGTGWVVRWDAPAVSDVTLVEFFIQTSNAINVFVGTSENDPNYKFIRANATLPKLKDPAGTNARDPQARTLTVVMRGGTRRFYKFVEIPVVQVTIRLQMPAGKFYAQNFIANIALLLNIVDVSRIKIVSVHKIVPAGFVEMEAHEMKSAASSLHSHFKSEATSLPAYDINFTVEPAGQVTTIAGLAGQIKELQQMRTKITSNMFTVTQQLQNTSGTKVLTSSFIVPSSPVILDPLFIPSNTTNMTAYRLALIKNSTSLTYAVSIDPTAAPTHAPVSKQPTVATLVATASEPATLSTASISLIVVFTIVGCLLLLCIFPCKKTKKDRPLRSNSDSTYDVYDPRYGVVVYDKSKARLKALKNDESPTIIERLTMVVRPWFLGAGTEQEAAAAEGGVPASSTDGAAAAAPVGQSIRSSIFGGFSRTAAVGQSSSRRVEQEGPVVPTRNPIVNKSTDPDQFVISPSELAIVEKGRSSSRGSQGSADGHKAPTLNPMVDSAPVQAYLNQFPEFKMMYDDSESESKHSTI